MMLLSISTILAIAIITIYTIYLAKKRQTELYSWLNSILSTTVSIFLGVVTAILILTYQENINEISIKNKLLSLVSLELENNSKYLQNEGFKIIISGNTYNFRSSILEQQAIDSAALSGLFSEKQSRDLLTLGTNIRFYNSLIKSIDSIYMTEKSENKLSLAQHLHDNQIRSYKSMGPNIEKCLDSLGLNSSKQYLPNE